MTFPFNMGGMFIWLVGFEMGISCVNCWSQRGDAKLLTMQKKHFAALLLAPWLDCMGGMEVNLGMQEKE